MIKLSVIIPFYNADQWIGRMLSSLLSQDLKSDEYEIIIIDDGSSESVSNLMNYVNKYSNIIYHRQENAGPGGARNTGLKIARGEYVMFCDSDDYVVENVFDRLYQIAHGRDLDMLFYNVPRIYDANVCSIQRSNFDSVVEFSTGRDYFAQLIVDSIRTGAWQYLIKRDFIERKKLSFPSNRIMNEDSCFFIDAILAAGRTGKIEADVYFYVQNSQSLIHFIGKVKQPEKWANNTLIFIRKLTSILNDNDLLKEMPKGFVDNIRWLRNQKAYILLIRSCRTLSVKEFEECISTLKTWNAYPKPFGNKLIFKWLFLKTFCIRLINRLYSKKSV